MSKYPSQMQDKFNLRFPDGMRDAIAERAKANGRSMNSEIVQILQDALEKEASSQPKDQELSDSELACHLEEMRRILDLIEVSKKKNI